MDSRYILRSEGIIVVSRGAWASGEDYVAGNIVQNSGSYLCTADHTADSAHEPGVGANWQDVFAVLAVGTAGPQGIPGGTLNWRGSYSAVTAYSANDGVLSSEGRGCYALQATTGHAPPSYPDTSNAYWSVFAEAGLSGGSASFWTTVPGTPTRVSDSQFTITDASGANNYAAMLPKGTVLKWTKSGGGDQMAIIKTAAYGSNTVTIDILGNTLAAGFTAMKYCMLPAVEDVFIIPGNMPGNTATADIGKTLYWKEDRYVLAAQVNMKTAPTTTNGVWDINDDSTTIFTSKPTATAAQAIGTAVGSDSVSGTSLTPVAANSEITLDYDSGHATTPGSNAYVYLWSIPVAWRYRT